VQTPKEDIWVYDLSRGTLTRLTFEGANSRPLWTPDGKRIAFRSDKLGLRNLFWKLADGTGAEEQLTKIEYFNNLGSVSPDGKLAFYNVIDPKNRRDIWMVPLEGERKPSVFLQTPFEEAGPKISPDGRWLAHTSNESGRIEIYVRAFPGPGGKWQISTEGGEEPLWARNGRELFYRTGDKMMAVDVNQSRDRNGAVASGFSAGTPRLVFEGKYERLLNEANFDISPDGQRFLMIKPSEQQAQAAMQIHVVLNWFEELKRRGPAGR
jgi:Tol biopolymer transport system component